MKSFRTHYVIKVELNIERANLARLEAKETKIFKRIGCPSDVKTTSYDDIRVQSSKSKVDLVKEIDTLIGVRQEIIETKNNVESLEQTKKYIEKQIKSIRNKELEYNIYYLKQIEGLTLNVIAKRLNYNYNYVRRVYSQIMKQIKENKQVTKT